MPTARITRNATAATTMPPTAPPEIDLEALLLVLEGALEFFARCGF